MEKVNYQNFNESIYHELLDNGLNVYMIPKKDYHKTFVTFTTNYGSFDQSFIDPKTGKKVNQPAGIAHFLEHKMFSMPDKTDAFEMLSKLGVNANAYTSFDRTSYLFSGTNNVVAALDYLLHYVQTPYFTPSSVKKEQGIIDEELRMYQDYPSQRLFYGLLQNLYQKHPVNTEIGGTTESIKKITAKKLYQAYDAFYHPSNMVLVLVGNFEPEEMINVIKDNQAKKGYKVQSKIERFMPKEPKKIVESHSEIDMSVMMPKVGLGLKLVPGEGLEALKQDFALSILLDMYFSSSSKYYNDLLKEGLVNESFEYSTIQETNVLSIVFTSDTSNPKLLEERLSNMLLSLKRKKLNEQAFLRLKKTMMGQFIMSLNSLESISMSFSKYNGFGISIFDVPSLIEAITLDDLVVLSKQFNKKYLSSIYILPSKA
ncbi:MAG: pitrilysin family protein [Acholeplasma sp.]|nr:pitrilysin family protein [Acholeplasma sp.]